MDSHFISFFRFNLIGLEIFALVLFLKSRVRYKFIFCGYIIGILAYLLQSILEEIGAHNLLRLLFILVGGGTSFFLWLAVRVFFEDDFTFKYSYLWILFFKILLLLLLALFSVPLHFLIAPDMEKSFIILRFLIVAGFNGLLIFASIYSIWSNHALDLLDYRIRMRKIFLICSGGFFFVSILIHIPIYGNTMFSNAGDLISLGFGFIFSFLFLINIVELHSSFLEEDIIRDKREFFLDTSIGEKIIRIFENQKLYLDEDMTIRRLSDLVGEKEYKVRHFINQKWQFKNFNEFLNRYRIKEACELLRMKEYPITRIGFEVGYKSLSHFNRAFKSIMKLTPSEYRTKLYSN